MNGTANDTDSDEGGGRAKVNGKRAKRHNQSDEAAATI
jgi:hypothetical protein